MRYFSGQSLNNARIWSWSSNWTRSTSVVVWHDSCLMRLDDSLGVPRQHFIDEKDFGGARSCDETWLDRMATCGNKKNGVQFIRHERKQIDRVPAPTFTRWLRKRGS